MDPSQRVMKAFIHIDGDSITINSRVKKISHGKETLRVILTEGRHRYAFACYNELCDELSLCGKRYKIAGLRCTNIRQNGGHRIAANCTTLNFTSNETAEF